MMFRPARRTSSDWPTESRTDECGCTAVSSWISEWPITCSVGVGDSFESANARRQPWASGHVSGQASRSKFMSGGSRWWKYTLAHVVSIYFYNNQIRKWINYQETYTSPLKIEIVWDNQRLRNSINLIRVTEQHNIQLWK